VKNTSYPRFRQASFEDYPRIAALETRYGLPERNYEQWSYVWTKNPAYQQVREDWAIGWVLENENKQIVGSLGNIPLLYELDGRTLIAASGRAWVVEPPYRGYALRLILPSVDQDSADLYINTTPNLEGFRALNKLGALRVPVGAWDRKACWVTNYRGVPFRWLNARTNLNSLATSAFSYLAGGLLFLREKVAESSLRYSRNGFDLQFGTTFDDRFDRFWEELKCQNPRVLLAVRTREVLDWHFTLAREQHRLWIWTATRAAQLIAYCICLKFEDTRSAMSRVSLIDFQSLDGNAILLLPIVSAILEKCRREGIHFLENPGLSFAETGINEAAPYNRPLGWWRYIYKARDRKLAETLSAPEAWAPSLYDGDASIL
jgi:hypothetical protein